MNTIAARQLTAPQPLVSATAKIAAVTAVAAVLAFATLGAKQASHQAVQSATASFSQGTTKHVTFDRVEIVGRRATGDTKKI